MSISEQATSSSPIRPQGRVFESLKIVIILLLGSLFFAALLAPTAFEALRTIWGRDPWPFSRVFDRVAMISLLTLVIVNRHKLRLDTIKALLKLPRSAIVGGFFFGAIVATTVGILCLHLIVGTGELFWVERTPGQWLDKIPSILLSAFFIAIAEEIFFRAIFLQAITERLRPWKAAICVSMVYAVVHFIAPVKTFSYTGWTWSIGFEYLGEVSFRLLEHEVLLPYFGLTILGITLCYLFFETKNIFLCIGLHFGWVIMVKLCLFLTDVVPGHLFPASVGRRYFLISEPIGWVAVVVAFLVSLAWVKSSFGRHINARASLPINRP